MTVSYRNKFTAYKQEHESNYAPIGSILPVVVDSFSGNDADNGGIGTGGESAEYGYKGYLYCDGRSVKIRDYPQLYAAIRNTYGGGTVAEPKQSTDPGGIKNIVRLSPSDSSTPWFIIINQDVGVNSTTKLPYPYGVTFRFIDDTTDTPAGNGLGVLNPSEWDYDDFYGTEAPTDAELTSLSLSNTEFAYKIIFPDGTDPSTFSTTLYDMSGLGSHPTVQFSKNYTITDYPYNVGTFNLPDYRERIVVGVGGVDGDGTPTIENALVNQVGQVGGSWYISKNQILEGGIFFTLGDVRTRGYNNIVGDIFTYVTGSVEYRTGPLEDHIFSRPVEHNHKLLTVEPDLSFDNEVGLVDWEEFAVTYNRSNAQVAVFEPDVTGGIPYGHSHGITADVLNDPTLATYGNTDGIGGNDPNTPANIQWDVSDPYLTSRVVEYDDISLEPHGPGTGEWEGFGKDPIAQSNRYLAFGYRATATGFSNPDQLKVSRGVIYNLDFTGYTQLFVYSICGNDSNGGERPNNPGEGLYCIFSDGTETRIFPSVQDYKNENGLDQGDAFSQYDAIYARWSSHTIDIPTALQNQPNQTVELRQRLEPGSEQGPEVPAGNDNANDMLGIQTIGLRGGITTEIPDTPGEYPVTGAGYVDILTITYDAGLGYCLVTTGQPHGYAVGKTITISGATPSQYNGDFEIIADQFAATTFAYVPDETPTSNNASGGTMLVRLSPGYYETVTTIPDPQMYTVDADTIIGGKPDIFETPGGGITFQDADLDGEGTINMNPVAASEGDVTSIRVEIEAPGGGGGGTNNNGGDAGYAYITFNLDGNSYTVYAYGGSGGGSGNSGAAGGSGGTVLIPTEILNDPRFDWGPSDGEDGDQGGGTGTNLVDGGGPYNPTTGAPLSGTGGKGAAETYTVDYEDSGYTRYTNDGTYTPPAVTAEESTRRIDFRVAGGGGGGANNNENSGCNSGAIGGSGGGGALISGSVNTTQTFGFDIGKGGGAGFNNKDGNTGTGSEAGGSSGGTGAAQGGGGGQGAWGNGATAGGGGGATALTLGGLNVIGAGGGGGGGGSGGGYNGGGTTDGCYAGGNHQSASTNLHDQDGTPLDFNIGGNGTSSGCTSGGGGGGGGGCGPQGTASGGDAGQAGVGHNGNGGGTGGRRGDSSYRSDVLGASWSTAGNGGSPGNAGGTGYVEFKFSRTETFYGERGGGGGEGASLQMTLRDTNIAMIVGVQTPGSAGGNRSQAGGAGSASISYRGRLVGDPVEGDLSSPRGNYYLCDETGVPSGGKLDGAIWLQSSNGTDTKDENLTPVLPGLGSNSTNKFAMASGPGAPTYNGKATKYIPFIGPGDREYLIGPFDLTFANKIRFTIIGGSGFNGGSQPEEDLLLYWKTTDGTTVNLLNTIAPAASVSTTWAEVDIDIPANSNAKDDDIQLILRQTRPAAQGDNATNTEDNYGISAITIFYDEVTTRNFVPTEGNYIRDIDYVDTTVSVNQAGLGGSEGQFEMSSSTPISTTVNAIPESDIPLITRYHKVRYLVKAN